MNEQPDVNAELQRLYEENQRLRELDPEIMRLTNQRNSLLEALKAASKAIHEYRTQGAPTTPWEEIETQALEAIEQAEGDLSV